MYSYAEYEALMKSKLSAHRFYHSQGVAHFASALAMANGLPYEKCLIAGILHDCAKPFPENEIAAHLKKLNIPFDPDQEQIPGILHANYGEYLARTEYEIEDREILNAILYHSTGRPAMNFLEKAIFLGDFLEVGRNHICKPSLQELRKLAFLDMDRCVYQVLKCTCDYIDSKGGRNAEMQLAALRYYSQYEQ